MVANDDFPKAVMVEKRYKSFKPYWAVVTKSIDRGMFIAKLEVMSKNADSSSTRISHNCKKSIGEVLRDRSML